MKGCSLERLVLLLDRKLSLNTQLGIFDHLDRCWYCKEAVYRIARNRDLALFLSRSRRARRKSAA